jgi:hypothetical protein
MDSTQLNWIANFIWGIADDVLRDVYVRGKYRDVILPMTVIRRLDAVLEPAKGAVLTMKKQLDQAGIVNQRAALCQASGQAFYNTSPFTLRDFKARAKQQQLKADFEAYPDGFSPNAVLTTIEDDAERHGVKLTAKRQRLLQTELGGKNGSAEPVIRKKARPKKEADPAHDALYGRYHVEIDGNLFVFEYEPDAELRDTEQVPLLESGSVGTFFRREVLPHVPDAWIDESATRIGYEINFNRYFYKPQPLRTLEEIRADIPALEQETEGLLQQILLEG